MANTPNGANHSVQPKRILAIALAAIVFAGFSYAVPAQNAFAHNFSHTETTEFLAAVEMTKTYLDLARIKAHDDPELAAIYAERAPTFLEGKWLSEIEERNQRIATDLSASLSQFPASVDEGRLPSELRAEVHEIKSLLAEAVSVRIDREELTDSSTQSLVMAKVLSESLLQYQVSQGVDEELAYELAYGIKKMSEMGDSMNMTGHGDMNQAQYEASKALASKAFYISIKVKRSDATDPALVDAAKMGLRQVKNGIHDSQPWQQVIGTMHQKVHENLRVGFNLQMQMQDAMH
jgi:hypothetical protein